MVNGHNSKSPPQLISLLKSVTHNLKGHPGDLCPSNGLPWIEYEDWFVHPSEDDTEEPYSWLASNVQSIESYSPPKRGQDLIETGQDQAEESSDEGKEDVGCSNSISFGTLSIEDDFELVFEAGNSLEPSESCNNGVAKRTMSNTSNSSDRGIIDSTDSCNERSDSSSNDSVLFQKLGMNRFIDCDFD